MNSAVSPSLNWPRAYMRLGVNAEMRGAGNVFPYMVALSDFLMKSRHAYECTNEFMQGAVNWTALRPYASIDTRHILPNGKECTKVYK